MDINVHLILLSNVCEVLTPVQSSGTAEQGWACSSYSLTLKMGAARYSATSVNVYQSTRRIISGERTLLHLLFEIFLAPANI
jgi:hypothetical protein